MLHSWSRTQRLKALVALMYGVQAALAIDLDLKSTGMGRYSDPACLQPDGVRTYIELRFV